MRASPHRSTLPGTFTLRRLLFAALVGSTVAVALGGAIGFAVAQDTTTPRGLSPAPDTFSVPPAHLEDRGTYTREVIRFEGDELVVVQPEAPLMDFAWVEERPLRDLTGVPVFAQRLNWTLHGDHNPEGRPYDYLFDQEGRFIGHPGLSSIGIGGLGEGPHLGPVNESEKTSIWSVGYPEDPPLWPSPPCALRHRLQYGPLDVTVPQALFGSCNVGDAWQASPCVQFRAVGLQDLGEFEALVFESVPDRTRDGGSCGEPKTHVWFSQDLPYPIRVTQRDRDDPALLHVLQLAQFHAGATALSTQPPELDPAPALEFRPRLPWGPDDSDVDHPFKLSQAYAWARDHPETEMAAFLADHPDAFLQFARYSEDSEDNASRIERDWWVGLQDEEATYSVSVTQTTRPVTEISGFPPSLPDLDDPASPNRVEYTFNRGSMAVPPLSAADLPAAYPTVRSVMERWNAWASPEFSSEPPNAWGIEMSCRDDCHTVQVEVSAGVFTDRIERGGPLNAVTVNESRVWTTGALTIADSGNATYFVEGRSEWARRDAPPPPATAQTGMTAAALDIERVRKVWDLPARETLVGAGAVGVLAGLVYWLWPLAKSTLPFGLFSRVERAGALDQPRRSELAALVEANPGIHFQEIVRRTGWGHGTVEHHLRKLVEVGVVAHQAGNGYDCYFAKGAIDRRLMAAVPVLKADGARRILEAVVTQPGTSALNVSGRAGLDPGTVSYHLRRLADAGLVEIERSGRELRIAPTELGRAALPGAAA